VDSSTSATKVELRDADEGTLLGSGRAPHPATQPPRSEQDPASWLAALRSASAAALAGAGVDSVTCVGVGAQQHGMVVTDSAGRPLRAAKLWNDTESAEQASRLVEDRGAQWWATRVGSVPVPAFTITKLAWLRECDPAVWRDLARVQLPHDWLVGQLTGRFVTDRGDASGTGYWSGATAGYEYDVLRSLDPARDWAAVLPEVLDADAVVGQLVDGGIELPGGPVVSAGTGDNMAAALALGLTAGDVCISMGTSGTVFAAASAPTADSTGAVAGFADATGGFLPLVCTLNATKVVDTIARLLGVDAAGFDALALSEPPRDDDPVLVPYFDGERTPNRPDASGTLAGLRNDVTREQLSRAAVTGVLCGLLDGLDALGTAGVPTGGRLFLIGGGARSAASRQLLADLAGRPVTPVEGELVARGAAVQAAVASGHGTFAEVATRWGKSETVEVAPRAVPSAEIRARYAAAARDH
jgi:xylulokinase